MFLLCFLLISGTFHFNICFKNVHDWSFIYLYESCLKVSSHNFNICIMLASVSVDSLFLCELKFSWFLVCWVILESILDFLRITLSDSGLCLNPMKDFFFFFFFNLKQAVDLLRFKLQVPTCLQGATVSWSVFFSKSSWYPLVLFWVCITQWSVCDLCRAHLLV